MEFRKKLYYLQNPEKEHYFNSLTFDEVQTIMTFIHPSQLSQYKIYNTIDKEWLRLDQDKSVKAYFTPVANLKTPPPPPPPKANAKTTLKPQEQIQKQVQQKPTPLKKDIKTPATPPKQGPNKVAEKKTLPQNAPQKVQEEQTLKNLKIEAETHIEYKNEDGDVYKIKLVQWDYPNFQTKNKLMGDTSTEFKFKLIHNNEQYHFNARFHYDDDSYVDSIEMPGVVKSSKFWISQIKSKK